MKEYWLIFKDGNYWINKFFKRGFGHISILTRDDFNWIIIDPSVNNLSVDILNASIDNNVPRALRMTGHKIIYLKVNSMLKRNFLSLFKRGNCVEIVKYIIGFKCFAFTPYGLYKKLSKYSDGYSYPFGFEKIKTLI